MVWIGERILRAMPARQGCVTLTELSRSLGLGRAQIDEAVARMAARGLCVRARRGCYRRTPGGDTALEAGAHLVAGRRGPKGQRPASFRSRLWAALRIARKATTAELVELAAPGEALTTHLNQAHRYLSHLAKAGIVTRLARRQPGTHPMSRGRVQWLLVEDVGARAPEGPR